MRPSGQKVGKSFSKAVNPRQQVESVASQRSGQGETLTGSQRVPVSRSTSPSSSTASVTVWSSSRRENTAQRVDHDQHLVEIEPGAPAWCVEGQGVGMGTPPGTPIGQRRREQLKAGTPAGTGDGLPQRLAPDTAGVVVPSGATKRGL